MKPDFCKELSLVFGDYCKVYNGTDNTTRSRSIPCIALYPCCNVMGSRAFYSLTRVRIHQMNWKKMVITVEFIKKMNALDQEAAAPEPVGKNEQTGTQQPENNGGGESENVSGTPEPDTESLEEPAADGEQLEVLKEETMRCHVSLIKRTRILMMRQMKTQKKRVRTIKKVKWDGIRKPECYALVTKKLNERDTDNDKQKRGLEQAKIDEIMLVFQDLQAMEPIRKEEIPAGFKAHNTHLFTVEKIRADGSHDKYKNRLMAHGNEQDSAIYANWSSLTVTIQSLMTCLTLAACNSDCVVGKLDVKDAFIIPVYMQCRGNLKELILKVLPELKKCIGSNGVLYYRLHKALYGCMLCAGF